MDGAAGTGGVGAAGSGGTGSDARGSDLPPEAMGETGGAGGAGGVPGDGTAFGDPGDPTKRTKELVCAVWNAGHVTKAAVPSIPGTSGDCDAGSTPADAIEDAVRRLNMWRWLFGSGPVTNDPAQNSGDQQCALMMSKNGMLNHTPPSTWTCYTAAGAAAAGNSNLAAGPASAASAIDLFIPDGGVPSLGHRRHLMEPALSKIGVGVVSKDTCMGVFDRSGSGPMPAWWSYPNAGPAPRPSTVNGGWSFHYPGASLATATVKIVRASDGTTLDARTTFLGGGGGWADAILIDPASGWSIPPGDSARITVDAFAGGPITYDVTPVDCSP